MTGESLVEGDLASLAQRNPSKFQRLNQRMTQVGAGFTCLPCRSARITSTTQPAQDARGGPALVLRLSVSTTMVRLRDHRRVRSARRWGEKWGWLGLAFAAERRAV